jgi:hypothetical protein
MRYVILYQDSALRRTVIEANSYEQAAQIFAACAQAEDHTHSAACGICKYGYQQPEQAAVPLVTLPLAEFRALVESLSWNDTLKMAQAEWDKG